MKKIFLMTLFMLVIGVQSFCSAATIEGNHFKGDERLIYPVVHVDDAAIDKKINDTILAEIDRFVTDVYSKLHDDKLRFISTNYTVTCNEAGGTKILSMTINESYCYMRAAHPAYCLPTLNFNTATGELIDISYLTDIGEGIPESDLLDKLTQKLLEHCASKKISLYNDALPLKNLPKDFYWDENLHVHFIFQSYSVAAYAYGIIDIDIDD